MPRDKDLTVATSANGLAGDIFRAVLGLGAGDLKSRRDMPTSIGTFRVWAVVNMIAYSAFTENRAQWAKESCTMYTALAWGFVAFTAVMVTGVLWLAWQERQDRRAVAPRTLPRTSN